MNFQSFREFTVELRESVSNRQLVSQSFVAHPDDPEGKSGTVAHIVKFSGVKDRKEIIGDVVAVFNIEIIDGGRRRVGMESFILAYS
jgi:hypothetical protein